jgi:hypothetical protein
MGSNTKRKSTMAKRNRERKLLERRQEKQAKKDARKRAASEQDPAPASDTLAGNDAESGPPGAERPFT